MGGGDDIHGTGDGWTGAVNPRVGLVERIALSLNKIIG